MKPCDWDSRGHYERLITPLREKARELGYALAVHGTLKRDIDLIACPWAEAAVAPRALAEALFVVVGAINGVAHWSWCLCDRRGPFPFPDVAPGGPTEPAFGREFTLAGAPGNKPHGRLGWVINLTHGAGPYIDLTVMPRSPADVTFPGMDREVSDG